MMKINGWFNSKIEKNFKRSLMLLIVIFFTSVNFSFLTRSEGLVFSNSIIFDDFRAWDICYSNDHIIITSGKTLEFYNISSLLEPVHAATLNTTGVNFEVRVIYAKDNLLIAERGFDGIDIINVTDPSNPQKLSIISPHLPASIRDYHIANNLLFISHGIEGLVIYNISNPRFPTYVAKIDIGDSVQSVSVFDNLAYVISEYYITDYHSLAVLNITEPETPDILFHDETTFNETLYGIHAIDGLFYLLGFEGFFIGYPSDFPTYDYNKTSFFVNYEFTMVNDIMYTIAGVNKINAINVSEPTNPFIQEIYYHTSGFSWKLVVNYDVAYIAGGNGGFEIFPFYEVPTETTTPTSTIPTKIFGMSIIPVILISCALLIIRKVKR